MRDIRRRLQELKKENEELKQLLAISGRNRQEYENKVKSTAMNCSKIDSSLPLRFNTWNRTTVNVWKSFINPS